MGEKSSSGETALLMAIKAGHSAIARLLIESGASMNIKSDQG
jgi:ankyrin repeat protein